MALVLTPACATPTRSDDRFAVPLSPATAVASLPDGQMLDAAAVAGQLWFVQADPALEAGSLNFITGLGKQGIAP